MTSVTFDIPTLTTERLILRAPRVEDYQTLAKFAGSDRTEFVGGPMEARQSARLLGEIAGLWQLRGYSSFVAELAAEPGKPIGSLGPWFPLIWPEMEFGWTLWDGAYEGHGYVTEAMRTIIPWTWERTGLATACSFIDDGNVGSERVAKALGATLDQEMTSRVNAPGGLFAHLDVVVRAFRHRKGALV